MASTATSAASAAWASPAASTAASGTTPTQVAIATVSPPPGEPWLGEPDFAARLQAASTDEQQAWRDLAVVWLLTPLEGEPCAATAEHGVHCFKRRGTLAMLRQMDRPALLPLYGTDGIAHFAQLKGLVDGGVRLRLGHQVVRVSPEVLTTAWRGEFGTLWRVPPGYKAGANPSGPRVEAAWLALQLARASGATTAPRSVPGQARLRDQVQAFQQIQGLETDGQPGAMTLMQLNRATGVDEPRLAH